MCYNFAFLQSKLKKAQMVKFKLLRNLFRNVGVFCLVGSILVACGGGIGNGLPNIGAKPEPTSWTSPAYKVGDYFSIKYTSIDTSFASNPQTDISFSSDIYNQVGTDNSKTTFVYFACCL